MSLRQFLDIALHEASPDHSTVSRTRRRIDVETHQAVFTWVLQRLADAGLVGGKTVGIDATTLEANAALRSIVRRDTGEDYETFLQGLAEASGITTPTRAELARFDRKRAKKGSNDDWTHPQDPDAKITRMKDGRTRLAHKAEHAVDIETGAVVGVTVQDADAGDTQTMGRDVDYRGGTGRSGPARTGPASPRWWATRGITATRRWWRWPSWESAVTCPSRTAGGVAGGGNPQPGPPSTPTGDTFGVHAGGAGCASAVSDSSVLTPISTKRDACGACICAAMPTCSSDCSCTSAGRIWVCSCGN